MKATKKTKRFWVAQTQDLKYDVCGLGETQEQAERAVWNKVKSTNNSGYGLPPYGETLAEFRDNYMHSFQVSLGEAEVVA
jgi:hypothetical protein